MSDDVFTQREIIKLAAISKRQLEWVRHRLGPLLRPQVEGGMLFFGSEDVRRIMAELPKIKTPKKGTA
jgi:hypothetical protein